MFLFFSIFIRLVSSKHCARLDGYTFSCHIMFSDIITNIFGTHSMCRVSKEKLNSKH